MKIPKSYEDSVNKDFRNISRFRNRNRDFDHRQHIKRTDLSKYIKRYRKGTPYDMNWSIIEKAKSSTKINCCPLHLIERYHFTEHFNGIRLLNKKVNLQMQVDIFNSSK